MKNILKLLSVLVILVQLLIGSSLLFAQGPPPPPPEGHGFNNNQPQGGSAPIGNGISILLVLGAAWGGKKVYDGKKSL